jgi:hypothetical protein
MHDDDRAAPWLQYVEGPPDSHPGDQCRLLNWGTSGGVDAEGCSGAVSDGDFAPLVAAYVDKHPDQPGFFAYQTDWHRPRGSGRSQERILHEVMGVVGGWDEPSCQAVESILMRVDQGREPSSPILGRQVDRHGGNCRPSAHVLIDGQRPDYVGPRLTPAAVSARGPTSPSTLAQGEVRIDVACSCRRGVQATVSG